MGARYLFCALAVIFHPLILPTVVISTAPGGTGDLRIKALVPYLRKYVPGTPTLVMEYMDGGGGRKAANYVFRNARADGLTVGAMCSDEVEPLMPEELTKTINDVPRDPEVTDLLKNLSGAGPLPPR
jgi:tripartite-type tricarboxylate transporter receptor subunit TctC